MGIRNNLGTQFPVGEDKGITQNTRLVPYIGFNYLRVNTDGYNTDQGLRVKEQDQDVFTVPVGVKFAGDMQTASGWVMTPSMDIGYVHAFGDRDTQARTQVGATTAHTTMDVWAESVVRTSFGLKRIIGVLVSKLVLPWDRMTRKNSSVKCVWIIASNGSSSEISLNK